MINIPLDFPNYHYEGYDENRWQIPPSTFINARRRAWQPARRGGHWGNHAFDGDLMGI
jgi:hypothetical protein